VNPQHRSWFPWLLGLATLAAVVVVSLHLTEERELVALAEQAEPCWLMLALVLQALTYLAQSGVWRTVLRRAGTSLPWPDAYRLSLAKLFVDQALPTVGVSGTLVVVEALQQRAVARRAVMSVIAVDILSFYLTYAAGLVLALLVLARLHEVTWPLLIAAALLLVFASTVIASVWRLPGRTGGMSAGQTAAPTGIRRAAAMIRDADPATVHDRALLIRAIALHATIIMLDAATLWTLLRAVGYPTGFAAVFASFMVASLLRSVGFMPGGLGTFEAGAVTALRLAGVPVAAGLAATLLFRGLSFWLPMLPGLIFSRSLTRHPRPAQQTAK